jgi:hypothetical protein
MLSSHINFSRIVTPSTPRQDFHAQESFTNGLMKVLGLSHHGIGGISSALVVGRPEYFLGAGCPNPAEAGLIDSTYDDHARRVGNKG